MLLAHRRVAVGRLVRVAAERGFDARDALLQHREAVARLLLLAVGLLDPLRRADAAAGQLALPLRLHLEIGEPVLGFLRVGAGLAQAHLELLDGGARGVDLGIGLGERQPIGLGSSRTSTSPAATVDDRARAPRRCGPRLRSRSARCRP